VTSQPTLFISDLHLTPARPAINALLLNFLATRARTARALYILGDLFEYWIGDEAVAHPAVQPLAEALRALTGHGVPVYVLHGNRDFLLGPGFERATGARVLPDPSVIDLDGERVLISHGDQLCTADIEYLKFRTVVRNPQWQQEFLAKSFAEREAMARSYRELSQQAMADKKPEIMDVTPQAVDELMRAHNVRNLIHGHTHRPFDHRFTLDGTPARRIVLGDWYEQGSVLVCQNNQWILEALPLPGQSAASQTKP
jgi:UDP-2,3-diacylglucosamine hydrolase